jgi:hypothetical protein
MLQQPDGSLVCKRCGAPLHIPDGHTAEKTFLAASGEPVVRVVKVDGDEIHRCMVIVRRTPRRKTGWED